MPENNGLEGINNELPDHVKIVPYLEKILINPSIVIVVVLMRARKLSAGLAAIPFALTILLPVMNRSEPRILGIPLLWIWCFTWVALTTVTIGVAHRLERKEGR